MKKSVLSLLIGSAMLIAPMTASALTPMTADSLKDATGQAGVSIAIDGVKLESHVGAVTYTDSDGYQTLPETAANDLTYYTSTDPNAVQGTSDVQGSTSIVIGEKHKVQYINAIIGGRDTANDNKFMGATSANARALTGKSYTYVNTMGEARAAIEDNDATLDVDETTAAVAAGENLFETRALTIDAGTCRLLTEGLAANITLSQTATGGDLLAYGFFNTAPGLAITNKNIAGVVIGLPTLEIHTSADSYAIGIKQGSDHIPGTNVTALNSGKNFIAISKEASTLAILGGVLEIAPH